MENNEDKRTPIQQEIDRQKKILEGIQLNDDILAIYKDKAVRKLVGIIDVLQSLIEPGKEALIKAYNDSWQDMPCTDYTSEQWFTSTYTQQTKQDGSDF